MLRGAVGFQAFSHGALAMQQQLMDVSSMYCHHEVNKTAHKKWQQKVYLLVMHGYARNRANTFLPDARSRWISPIKKRLVDRADTTVVDLSTGQ